MEELKNRLKKLEELSLDPFNPEPLNMELQELLSLIPHLSREEALELSAFLQRLKQRLEENYHICFGWIEEAFKEGFRYQA